MGILMDDIKANMTHQEATRMNTTFQKQHIKGHSTHICPASDLLFSLKRVQDRSDVEVMKKGVLRADFAPQSSASVSQIP